MGRTHAGVPLARAGTRGKGAPAVLDLLSPLTETAAALPLAKEIWA